MRAGKEDGKVAGPLFPRLHVNDATDKGGPRAPPRNKMALYEQLSVPSQRVTSVAATPVLPLPPHASALSCQGGNERTNFSPCYLTPQAPITSVERVHGISSYGMNSTRVESQKGPAKKINEISLTGRGPVTECGLLLAHEPFRVRSSLMSRRDNEDDLTVPTFVQSKRAARLNKDRIAVEAEKFTALDANAPRKSYCAAVDSPDHSPSSNDKLSEHINDSSKEFKQNQVKHVYLGSKAAAIKENKIEPSSDLEIPQKPAELSRPRNTSHLQEDMQTVKTFGNSENIIRDMFQEESREIGLGGSKRLSDENLGVCANVVIVRNESCPKMCHEDISHPAGGNGNHKHDTKIDSLHSKDNDRRDDVSDTSMVDSLSGLDISPDDVVGLIGPKQFWKARRAIVNQQRVFAVQVFELHRLIKVQKLIAASPHLLENYPCLDKSLQKVPTKNLSSKAITKLHTPSVKDKDDMDKQNTTTKFCREYTKPAPHVPPNEDVPNKGHSQAPRSGTYSENPHPTPLVHENNANPWCLHPPANQWLVPVMSPSEGLIYKPYTGPYPPGNGFVAPVYGTCGPLSLPPACGVPAAHQQQSMGVLSGAPGIPPSYFPTLYSLPVANPIISASAVEQVSPMVGLTRNNCQTEQNSRSSCNMLNSKSEALSGWKFRASKGSEIQGSTASSPCDKTQGEGRGPLPLFPMAPAAEDSTRPSESHDKDSNQTRVIKVVPRNARSATESAARIFRSIQEERQRYDS